jgi:hypothetical protein
MSRKPVDDRRTGEGRHLLSDAPGAQATRDDSHNGVSKHVMATAIRSTFGHYAADGALSLLAGHERLRCLTSLRAGATRARCLDEWAARACCHLTRPVLAF